MMDIQNIKTKITIFLFTFIYSLFFCALSAQTTQDVSYLPSYTLQNIEERINVQLEAYPQEKIHLHTDRDYYVPGEKIWFKAYVVDAYSHLHPTYSEYVYVELISPLYTMVNRVMVRQEDDMFYGHLPISNIVPEGNYTIRAYTRYMENMGDDYFFKKNIRIGNLSSAKSQQPQTVQRSRNSSKNAQIEKDDFDVSFYPEGGNLLEGVYCKVAFKAINKNGYPEKVSGIITEENGVEFTSVQTYHAGMGVFTYLQESGKKYYLICVNGNGLEKQFELPQPNPNAHSLITSVRDNRILVRLQKFIQTPDIPCYLLVHCRGEVLYFVEWHNQQEAISLMAEKLPAGVIQFVLFDGQMNPLSERLIFSKNISPTKVDFQTNREAYSTREKIVSTIRPFPPLSPQESEQGSFKGHFSVAVTDDKDYAVDETTTILSSLLLSSELRGYIENPAYYLQDDVAMDLLMMTHGWKRYNIPEVAKGNLEHPQIPFQMFQEISGQVNTLISNRPVSDSEIIIMMKGGNEGLEITSTDRYGLFVVQNLEFPDSTTVFLQALNKRGRDNVQLVVNQKSFPETVYAPQSPIFTLPVTATETKEEIKNEPDVDTFMEKAEQRAKFDEDIWSLLIEEVTITAPRIKKDDPRLQFYANESSSVTITKEIIDEYKFETALDYLDLVAGITVNHTFKTFTIRGPSSINAKVEPLIFIDGVDVTGEGDFALLKAHEIESIDIFKGASAAIFGARGAGGAISVTTKMRRGTPRPPDEKLNHIVYTPVGYQKPVAFFSPKYETLEAKQSIIPDYRTTIFWKPDLVVSEDGNASFDFYTSDFRTTYSVVIEGITSDGRMVRQVGKIRVE